MFEEDKLRLRTNKRVTVNLLRVFPACHSSRFILKTMSFDSLYMRKLKPVERSGIRELTLESSSEEQNGPH